MLFFTLFNMLSSPKSILSIFYNISRMLKIRTWVGPILKLEIKKYILEMSRSWNQTCENNKTKYTWGNFLRENYGMS